MTVTVDIDNHCSALWSPSPNTCQNWIQHALRHVGGDEKSSLGIRIVSAEESRELNRQYRQKSGATNVLSFPANLPGTVASNIGFTHLGDLVFCAEFIEQEAKAQSKSLEAHWAHLIVHGLLHLLGHDHQTEQQAEEMEGLEIEILKKLGIPNPYLIG